MKNQTLITYSHAEKPMDGAPTITFEGEMECIPQHFLTYDHTLESVEQILSDICFDENYPLFIAEEGNQIYLQAGIIGVDNYTNDTTPKIVYGRRWRVEKNLPTSEIIQTAFLALQKAREHEVRELLTLAHENKAGKVKRSTPFNGHHDLPFLARNIKSLLSFQSVDLDKIEIEDLLTRLRFDGRKLQLTHFEKANNGRFLIDLKITAGAKDKTDRCTGFENATLNIYTQSTCKNEILFAIMDALIKRSNQYVEEHFLYKDLARFSRKVSVERIGKISIDTRNPEHFKHEKSFAERFLNMNYEIDSARVPSLKASLRNLKIMDKLKSLKDIKGQLPSL